MDALVHRREIRAHLGPVFENPEIVKARPRPRPARHRRGPSCAHHDV